MSDAEIRSVADAPLCPGCLFASHLGPAGICEECWNRRERRVGGGLLRYIALNGDYYHEDPRCPDLDGPYQQVRDEDALYSNHSRCTTCRFFRLSGRPGTPTANTREEVADGE